jgi:hypothetical protein
MPFVLRKEGDTSNPTAPRLYGMGITAGLLLYYKANWQGTNRTAFMSILAEGARRAGDRGCSRLVSVFYAGFEIPEHNFDGSRNWRFHPGELTDIATGFDDPVQGAPEFFPEIRWTGSGLAWIELALSAELSDGEDEPSKLKVVMFGKLVQDFSVVTDADGLPAIQMGAFIESVNPALVLLDQYIWDAKMPTTRFHADSWAAFKARCAATIGYTNGGGDGLAATYFDDTTLTHAVGAETLIDFDKTGDENYHPPGITIGRYWSMRASGFIKVTDSGTYTFYSTHDDGVRLYINGTLVIDDWNDGGARERSGSIALTAGAYVSVVFEYYQLYGPIQYSLELECDAVGFTRQAWPLRLFYTTSSSVRSVTRYTASVVYTSPTPVPTAADGVWFRCPGVRWQDVNGKIKVLPDLATDPATVTLVFDPDSVTRSNIKSSKLTRRLASSKPNFFAFTFRDETDKFLTKQPPIFQDRDALRSLPGVGLVEAGVVELGVMTQSLAERIGSYQAIKICDLDIGFEVDALISAYALAVGDLCYIVERIADNTVASPVLCTVEEEAFHFGDVDNRSLKLQIASRTAYSDTVVAGVANIIKSTPANLTQPPPVAASLTLSEGALVLLDTTYVPTIEGLVTVQPFSNQQRVRIEYKRSADALSAYKIHGFFDPDPATLEAAFEIKVAESTAYDVRAVTVNRRTGGSRDISLAIVQSITVLGKTALPAAPGLFTLSYDGAILRGQWLASIDRDVVKYRVVDPDNSNAIVYEGDALFYTEQIAAGATVHRRVFSINASGRISASFASATYAASAPIAPTITSLTLEQRYGVNNTFITEVVGLITFPSNALRQTGKVYVTTPTLAERQLSFTLDPPLTGGVISFRYVASEVGTHTFRVTTETNLGVSTSASQSISVTNLTFAIATPTFAAGTLVGTVINYSWQAPTTNPERAKAYELWVSTDTSTTANRLYRGSANTFAEPVGSAPPNSLTRYLRAVDDMGNASSFVAIVVDLTPAPAPASFNLSFDGLDIIGSWPRAADNVSIAGYQVATDSSFTSIVYQGDALGYTERATAAGTFTRYLRSVSNLGKFSSSISQTVVVAAPAQPTAAAGSYDSQSNTLNYSWLESDATAVSYDIDDGAGVFVVRSIAQKAFTESPVRGTAAYIRRVRAVNRAGIASTWVSMNVTIPTPATPGEITASYDEELIRYAWGLGDSTAAEYEVADASYSVLDRTTARAWSESPVYGQSTYVRNVRAVNRAGIVSLWQSVSFTVPPPPVPSSFVVDFDGARILDRWSS